MLYNSHKYTYISMRAGTAYRWSTNMYPHNCRNIYLRFFYMWISTFINCPLNRQNVPTLLVKSWIRPLVDAKQPRDSCCFQIKKRIRHVKSKAASQPVSFSINSLLVKICVVCYRIRTYLWKYYHSHEQHHLVPVPLLVKSTLVDGLVGRCRRLDLRQVVIRHRHLLVFLSVDFPSVPSRMSSFHQQGN